MEYPPNHAAVDGCYLGAWKRTVGEEQVPRFVHENTVASASRREEGPESIHQDVNGDGMAFDKHHVLTCWMARKERGRKNIDKILPWLLHLA